MTENPRAVAEYAASQIAAIVTDAQHLVASPAIVAGIKLVRVTQAASGVSAKRTVTRTPARAIRGSAAFIHRAGSRQP